MEFDNHLVGFIENHNNNLYFKEVHFYKLIDKYVKYNRNNKIQENIALVFDSNSMSFIGNHYYVNSTNIQRYVQMTYTNNHPRAGEVFHNIEKIWFRGIDEEGLKTLDCLKGNYGFKKQLDIVHRSESIGCLFNEDFYIFNFNHSVYSSSNNKQNRPFNKQNGIFLDAYSKDEATKNKIYFFMKNTNKHYLLMCDIEKKTEKNIEIDIPLSTVYHWEINNGKLYYLVITDPLTDWKRTLYSVVLF
jgi:hypothetical protein